MSYGVGYRCSSDPELLWLWHRPVTTARIQPLAWEPPYAVRSGPRKGKKTKKKKKEKKREKEKKKCRRRSAELRTEETQRLGNQGRLLTSTAIPP